MLTLSAHTLYHSYKQRTVLHGVSFNVSTGHVVGVLGPNGAGKTTCFQIISGLMPPERGVVLWDHQDITTWRMDRRGRAGIRYLPQEPSVFQGLSVENNLYMILNLVTKGAKEKKRLCEQYLEEFRLTHVRKTIATVLSGGERRRLEIARSLIGDPKILLLDEPFAGIDPKGIEDLQDLIPQLIASRQIGILITDHNVRAALTMVDRAYILVDGRIVQDGSPQSISENEKIRRLYLGERFKL